MVKARLNCNALVLALSVLLAATAAPAQGQDAGPSPLPEVPIRTLVEVPVPTEPRLPAAPEAPDVIAARWFAATSDGQRRDIVLDVLSGIGMGVYTGDGTPILFGAEQTIDDPWLYDFEVALLAADPPTAPETTVADIAASLEGVLTDGSGSPFEAPALAELIRSATEEALADPGDPVGFPLRLARELELAASGRDLSVDTPVDEPLSSLTAALIELDILMPFTAGDGAAVTAASGSYVPVAAQLSRTSPRSSRIADAKMPRTAQICDRIASWAGKESWDIGKVGARLLRGGARLIGGAPPAQVLHGNIVRYAVNVQGRAEPDDIHYGHPDGEDGGRALFSVAVRVVADLPQAIRACGSLSGLRLPEAGALDGLEVTWITGNLEDHGTINCPEEGCRRTDSLGNARLAFAASTEPEMPLLGPEKYDRALVISRVRVALGLGNTFPVVGTWTFRDVRIGWHEPPRYRASGGGSGLSVRGTIDDLAKPFTLKGRFEGANVVFNFAPSSAYGGAVAYRISGKFAGSGEGSYKVQGNEEERTATLRAETDGCVKVPGTKDTCRHRSPVITLKPIE